MTWNGRGSGHGLSEVLLQHLLEGTEKPMYICHASWCHGQDSHQVLPSQPIPSVVLYNIIHHHYQNKCLIHNPVYLGCPYPSSYHNSLQVHILHVSKCHHMHSSIYFYSPSSNKVHLCWCKCSVKSQTMSLIWWWRPNVMTLLTAVVSLLKCLYKTGQSSLYHPATICISVLCPTQSLRSVTF